MIDNRLSLFIKDNFSDKLHPWCTLRSVIGLVAPFVYPSVFVDAILDKHTPGIF